MQTSPVTGRQCLSAFQRVGDSLAEVRILSKEIQQEQQAVDSANLQQLEQGRYDAEIDPYIEVVLAQTGAGG